MQLISVLLLVIVLGLGALWLLAERKSEPARKLTRFDFDAAKSREDVQGA